MQELNSSEYGATASHYRGHKSSLLDPTLSQVIPILILKPHFCKILASHLRLDIQRCLFPSLFSVPKTNV